RSAKVGAGLRHREQAATATNQQNRDAIVCSSGWLVVRQVRFSQHGNKLLRERLTVRAIDAYSVFVNQRSAQMGCVAHDRVTESRTEKAGSTRSFLTQDEGGRKQCSRAKIQQAMNQSRAPSRRINIRPISHPGRSVA